MYLRTSDSVLAVSLGSSLAWKYTDFRPNAFAQKDLYVANDIRSKLHSNACIMVYLEQRMTVEDASRAFLQSPFT